MSNLTLFDLDHTLLPIDSDVTWGNFLCRAGVVDSDWYRRRNDEFYEHYKAGTLNIAEFLQFCFAPLASHPRAQLDLLHKQYMADDIEPVVRSRALNLVDEHMAAGDLCAVVTATNAFVAGPIARRFGVPHIIATIPAQNFDAPAGLVGQFTGDVRGTPCFREGKIVRVEAWLESMGLGWGSFEQTTFYSDSRNDLPLLERVTHPVATNPDPTLRQTAQERGWRILELFND